MVEKFSVFKLALVREREVEYTIKNDSNVYNIAKTLGYGDFAEEYFGLFCLDAKGNVISYHEISHGDISSSLCHPREIFKRALLCNACGVIFVHNHPSGDCSPSDTDISTTDRLCKAGKILQVPVLDHIIIGNDNWFSFRKHDMIERF